MDKAVPAALPVAWIIERPGHLPTLCHYKECVSKMVAEGAIVTPYFSKVVK